MISRTEKNKKAQKKIDFEEQFEKRKKTFFLLAKILTVLILVLGSFYIYLRFIATTGLIIREYRVNDQMLPENFYGFKIIHFTDLHYGSTTNNETVKDIVNKINELKPDALVFTGDLIDEDYQISFEETIKLTSLLNEIQVPTTKYAILGEEDYKNYNTTTDILKNSNFTILDNTYDLLYYKGTTPILITGVNSSIQNKNDASLAFSYFNQEDAIKNIYTINLMHEPDTIISTKQQHNNINLALAGHSHNGQIRFPKLGVLIKPTHSKTYYDEFYQIDNTKLFISGGLGTSKVKLRYFTRPSINLYRLTNK